MRISLTRFLLLSLSACGADVRTTAYSRAKSPDQSVTAIVESKAWSGPGNNFAATDVSLQIGETQPPLRIVSFEHQYDTMKVRPIWLDAKKLLVRYGPSERKCDQVDVSFQAVKVADIKIMIEPLPVPAKGADCWNGD